MNKQEIIKKLKSLLFYSPDFNTWEDGYNTAARCALNLVEELEEPQVNINRQELFDKIIFEKYKEPSNYFQLGYNSGIERSLSHLKQINEQPQKLKQQQPFTSSTPPHYQGKVQPIDLINAQDLNFNLGNVVKYACRAGKKQGENILTDLEKAKDYINFEIERVKK